MKKVAIYSGEVPSTVFIERIIQGLSNNYKIYLFGFSKKSVTYNSPNIIVKTYSNGFSRYITSKWYSLLLSIFKKNEKKILDQWIENSGRKRSIMLTSKYYPVLWFKPDIFHLQWVKGIDDWSWVKLVGMKLMVSLRGYHINVLPFVDPETADIYRKLFPLVDNFHAVSKDIRDRVVQFNAPFTAVHVIYSGLDIEKLKNRIKKQDDIKNQTVFKILSVGRPHWVKGYNYALDCCKLLKDAGLNFNYTIIGAKGVEELEYQRWDLNLEDNLDFLNNVSFDEVMSKMNVADVFLLPSVHEGIANVVLEAMSLGKIVLSTDCNGMDEVIEDGVNGFIVSSRDSKGMAEKLIYISSLSKDKMELISQNAIKTIKGKFTYDEMITKMSNMYEGVHGVC